MSKVYVVKKGGITETMTCVRCKDEDKELQQLLEKNHDLLPGGQINPEDPRRWLLLKREMPVPDPGTGENRWSIDFFFVDQGGMPTFVECKRFKDTRSRREVVGQMLEYAANGHYYWTKEIVQALVTDKSQNADVEKTICEFEPDTGDSVEDFFELIENNLKEGQIRLVFFLEEAPHELKSIVDFLNKQMERSEVLIVEAKQYVENGYRVLVPSLFGYTEQARRVKKTRTLLPTARRKWDESEFFEDAKNRLDAIEVEALKNLFNFVKSKDLEIRWGNGSITGSFNVIYPRISNQSIIGVCSDGKLYMSFRWLKGEDGIDQFRDELAHLFSDHLRMSVPRDSMEKCPALTTEEWGPKIDEIKKVFDILLEKYS
jgi:hypothetical protein